MKKNLILVLACVSYLFTTAQLTVPGNRILLHKNSVDVVIFDSISNQLISYAGTNVRFYKYADANSNSNPIYPTLSPEDATGYIVKVDDVPKDTIWVIDYHLYKPILKSIQADKQSPDQCTELNLLIESNVSNLTYKTPTSSYTLPRKFKISYQTVEWSGSSWSSKSLTDSVYLYNQSPTTKLITTVPLCDTKFTITGDQYAEMLGISVTSAVSDNYSAVAVKSQLTVVVTPRNEKNEESAPHTVSGNANVSFSAPFDVQFLSNPSPAVSFFKWVIYKDDVPILTRNDSEHRYTFTEYGIYKIKLTVSNATCSYSDSITINAIEAAIQVPNVFTPNGDGMNDEFRVAYKSLLDFECWVYNRWGRQVYHWNDPQKGWNGKISGADAAEGPYFYIIKASGYGLNPKEKNKKIKSSIVLSGDINLLRGSK